ncbi:MFS transporter [Maridesulfovibrio sp.]|uniref:MFS transporter n=1 Tax=Maridesulfovibrio sp. TaxID=2795000 RepID=UPI0029CA17C8|nr:MFS transporter [Maridesulfovibrio sp.]
MNNIIKIQLAVFALVSASFTNIYLPQPVLPILQSEFQISPVQASFAVSFVILGIVLSNLFFGYLSDRYPVKPIIVAGGVFVAAGGFICASTDSYAILVGARLVQGLFIPALTTSIAAWLARTLPAKRLSVVMGAYVSATILGGLGGRLLGGWIHPPLHWRYAFSTASVLILVTTLMAVLILPSSGKEEIAAARSSNGKETYASLLKRKELLLVYACGAGSLLIFSPVFNYLPYRLSHPPFDLATETITLVYLVYVLGIFLGPLSGRLCGRLGGGLILICSSILLGVSLFLLLLPSITAVVVGLSGVCAGFFTLHTVAVVLLNRKLTCSHGKANALYVLCYYSGGWLGLTGAGFAYECSGWNGVIFFLSCFLIIPLSVGLIERRAEKRAEFKV